MKDAYKLPFYLVAGAVLFYVGFNLANPPLVVHAIGQCNCSATQSCSSGMYCQEYAGCGNGYGYCRFAITE